MDLVGRLHPLIVHFPIALLVLGAAVALAVRGREGHALRPTLTLLLRVGALGAIAAAATGWLLAGQGEYHGAAAVDLERHRWLGVGVALTSAALALLAGRISRSAAASVLGMLVLTVGVSATGHLGGELVFGEGYLLNAAPEPEPEVAAAADGRVDFRRQVQPILRRSCHKCHSGRKREGDLRLDRKDLAMGGGEEGPVIVPGDAEKSELIRRITLSRTDEDYMPAKGAPLTPAQIQTLKDWVNQGADWPE